MPEFGRSVSPVCLALLGALSLAGGAAFAQQAPQAQPAPRPAPAATPATATAPAELPIVDRGWRVVCQSLASDRSALQCVVLFEAFRDTGQRLLALEIGREGTERRLFVTAPLGVSLAAPLDFAIDKSAPVKAAYQVCQAAGCIAAAPLRAQDLEALRRGKVLTVSYEIGGQKLSMPVSLDGFSAAMRRAE